MKLELKIRRLVIQIDEIHQEMQKNVDPPARKALAAGVFYNPYAGRYVEDLEPMFDLGAEIGGLLATRAVEAIGVKPGAITSYGKGALIGNGGEIEHAAAILHPRFGKPVREAVEREMISSPPQKKWEAPGRSWCFRSRIRTASGVLIIWMQWKSPFPMLPAKMRC